MDLNKIIREEIENLNKPRILQVIDAYEKAAQEANQSAFDAPPIDSGSWRGTFDNAMSPDAHIRYQEYMKNQSKVDDRNTKASELQDKAQGLADEIKKEYNWIVKATRGKGMKKYASLSDMINYFKAKYSQQPLNEQTYKVYHGTNQQFDKFDFNRATQGIVWFTDSPESIQKGEHGGAGNKIIMTRYITINNPAGWEEYEKYGLQQLEDMGYDGVILPQGDKNDYFVFSNKSIKKTGPKDLSEEDYRGSHTAPGPNSDDSPMYDVTPMYGEDIYGPEAVRMFGNYRPLDKYSISLIQQARNKPNMQVRIYRAVPKVITNQEKIDDYQKRMKYILKTGKLPRDVDNFRNSSEYYDWLSTEIEKLKTQPTDDKTKINNGDWVTINPIYAKEHGLSNLGNKFRVLTKTVSAKQLYTDGNDINEWGYNA